MEARLVRVLAALLLAAAVPACGGGGGAAAPGAPPPPPGTFRISVNSSGAQATGAFSRNPSISANGDVIAFESDASDLVAGDTNGMTDVFVRVVSTGVTTRVSVSSAGTEGNGASGDPHISDDGKIVAFASAATNLVAGDTNARADIFVHDRQTGTTTRVSVDGSGAQGDGNSSQISLSSTGRFVAFRSESTNLVVGDTNDY